MKFAAIWAMILASVLSVDGHGAVPEAWVAYGELRGHIEPCGCDPKTDLGGIERVGVFIDDARRKFPGVEVFSLGNNLPYDEDVEKIKGMLGFEEAIQPGAILFSELDEKHWSRSQSILGDTKSSIPYVLSREKRPAGVAYVLERNGYQIFGFRSGVEPPPLADWKKRLKNQGVLLFAGSDRDLRKIQDSGLFDLIILGNQLSYDKEPTLEERHEPGRLLRLGQYMVPAHGQGILQSALLGKKPKISLPGMTQDGPSPSLKFATPSPVVWLDRGYHGRKGLADGVMRAYLLGARGAFRDLVKKKVAANEPRRYAGAEACRGCHSEAYKIWRASDHGKAYETLRAVEKHEVQECVSCHVVGLDDSGGFISDAHTPNLAGVQCENCHGPALEHIRAGGGTKLRVDQKVCKDCHKLPHSSNFQWPDYWPKIEHR